MNSSVSDRIRLLADWVSESKHIVFFGGAGVSTASGIPDFRSTDGLYHQTYAYPPETILSHSFYQSHTEEFFDFYRKKMLFPNALPNAAHKTLARWEQEGRLSCVITQNIDGLHQAAGSRRVLELHGSVHRNTCQRCGASYDLSLILASEGIPRCPACSGIVKPDVVLYEEGLDQSTIREAICQIEAADLLIIAGTSLAVYPAAGLIDYYRGSRLVVINKAPTPKDTYADMVIDQPVESVLAGIS